MITTPLRVTTFVRRRPARRTLAGAMVLATAVLAACGKSDDGRTPGQQLDAAIARASEASSGVRQQAARDLAEVRVKAGEAASQVRERAPEVASSVEDAATTARIKAEFMRDDTLKARDIDVHTQGSKVTLRGQVPDAAARERAGRLAHEAKGVTEVDNGLTVSPAVAASASH